MPYCSFCGKLCPTALGLKRHIDGTSECKKASNEEYYQYANSIWDDIQVHHRVSRYFFARITSLQFSLPLHQAKCGIFLLTQFTPKIRTPPCPISLTLVRLLGSVKTAETAQIQKMHRWRSAVGSPEGFFWRLSYILHLFLIMIFFFCIFNFTVLMGVCWPIWSCGQNGDHATMRSRGFMSPI